MQKPAPRQLRKSVLIVDDEPAIRDMVAFALRQGDYEPVHAGDAARPRSRSSTGSRT